MRKGLLLLLSFVIIILLNGCVTTQQHDDESIYQYATLDALLAGVYDGELTFGELSDYGDTGLGTLQHLDGEMIALDGIFYQIDSEGNAHVIDETGKTPFAVVTDFSPDITLTPGEVMDLESLYAFIDGRLPSENLPYCIRITGRFSYMKTRSVPAQEKPYPKLLDVLKTQPIFEFGDISGDIIGFRLPEYMGGANAAGYHFHFITADRSTGGHVLACTAEEVTVQLDESSSWYVSIPQDESFRSYVQSHDTY